MSGGMLGFAVWEGVESIKEISMVWSPKRQKTATMLLLVSSGRDACFLVVSLPGC